MLLVFKSVAGPNSHALEMMISGTMLTEFGCEADF